MSTRLREVATSRLRALCSAGGEASVKRLTVDVEVAGRVEAVILSLRNGELRCVASDGCEDGPHVTAALELLAGPELREDSSPPGMPALHTAGLVEASPLEDVAEALEDLLTAITRVGVDKAQYAPSVDSALERLVAAAPQPTPSGLGRFIGRLQHELRSAHLGRVARLLEGSSQLVESIRLRGATPNAEERLGAWLGVRPVAAPQIEMLYDRTMLEVGREWLAGADRASVERRYLIDVESGLVYREDRPRNAAASLGPCPRALHVGLAEVEPGPAPHRIRLLQYEVQPNVGTEVWELLQQAARWRFAEVTEGYRRAVKAYPSLSEPFALVAPHRIERDGIFKAFDAEGHQLVLNRSERRGAALAFYELLGEGVEPSWLAGRLTDIGNTLCLTPFAVGTRDRPFIRL